MKILQRYILIEILKVFLLLLSVLTVLLLFVGVFTEAQKNGLGTGQILLILPYIIPSLLPYIIPSSLLLSVCVVYGRISGDLEIVAAKSAGINPLALLTPAFTLGAVLAVCSFFLTDRMIPWSMSRMQSILSESMEEIFLDQLRATHLMTDRSAGYTISVVDVRDKTLISPTFQYSLAGGTPLTLQAQEARISFDLENQVIRLNLKKCHVYTSDQTTAYLEEEQREFPMPKQIAKFKERGMTIETMHNLMDEFEVNETQNRIRGEVQVAFALTTGNYDLLHPNMFHKVGKPGPVDQRQLDKMSTEIYGRFALSSSCLFFVFLGAPYAINRGTKQFLTTFFICFLPILLIYYPLIIMFQTLGKNGEIDPSWAMWIPNVIMFFGGIRLLRQILKH